MLAFTTSYDQFCEKSSLGTPAQHPHFYDLLPLKGLPRIFSKQCVSSEGIIFTVRIGYDCLRCLHEAKQERLLQEPRVLRIQILVISNTNGNIFNRWNLFKPGAPEDGFIKF